jgi:hypothetical protein
VKTTYRIEGLHCGQWDSDIAGNGDNANSIEDAEAFIGFLLEEFPETTRADWRYVAVTE